jgi:sortase A
MKKKVIISILFFTGLLIFSYPIVSNWFSTQEQHTVISRHNEVLKSMTKEEKAAERKRAEKYNETLNEASIPIEDPFSKKGDGKAAAGYFNVLNIGETIGSIEIPSINVTLPIYHGVSEEVLQRGVGHMSNSSLPIGGHGSHAALTGHRGLPSSKLFTDLDKLTIGDVFFIHTLDETLAYKVDDIKIVLPDEMDWLVMDQEKDYVTLITCEPYMINTHRLLVRGERVPYSPAVKNIASQKVADTVSTDFVALIIAAGTIIALFLFIPYMRHKKRVM